VEVAKAPNILEALAGVGVWSLENELGDHAEYQARRPEHQTNAHTLRLVPTIAKAPANGGVGGLAGASTGIGVMG
jgi:hypothetical protein